jgi:hypothetical protein
MEQYSMQKLLFLTTYRWFLNRWKRLRLEAVNSAEHTHATRDAARDITM